jgi:hypothetical protein
MVLPRLQRRRSEQQMQSFREVLKHCDMVDLGFKGLPWTFDNKQSGKNNVRVRLDRAVAQTSWLKLFPETSVEHLVTSRSDHCPLLIRLGKRQNMQPSKKNLRYEVMWEREESLAEEIQIAWESIKCDQDLGGIKLKLTETMSNLQKWSKETFGAVEKELKNLRKKLETLQLAYNPNNLADIAEVQKRMDELLIREELMWLQRSRVAWLKEGDRNTSFFHRKASHRARKNKIKKLKHTNGSYAENNEEIKGIVTTFFKNLYTNDRTVNPSVILDLVQGGVTDEMNGELLKEYTDQEIGDALFQIGPLKAPGPDGFPARFFQRNWGIMKEDVIGAVKHFFKFGVIPEGINETVIVLIPKTNDAEDIKDFRSISLCNVVYKVVSKCIVNRLRPMLQLLISETQSAFLPGRLISDNALIAFECFHHIQKNKKADDNYCAYKLDLTKAYDRVDWGYLEGILLKFGFHKLWVKQVMACFTSVTFKVRVNGDLTEEFKPEKGLR